MNIIKWVLRLHGSPGGVDWDDWYYGEHEDGESYVTNRLSEAKIYDVKYFADTRSGYDLIPVTKKQLFEVRLTGK